MRLITLDLETYYDKKEYSLSKMTTEEYVRDPRFEVIGVGVKLDNKPTEWASGDKDELSAFFASFPWEEAMVVCHNTVFDGAVLSWHFGINPRVWADTLCIGRSLHGVNAGGSLRALAERYGVGVKGTEVDDASGKRRSDFTENELSRYGDYCINDVDITYKLFHCMVPQVSTFEMKLIDLTLRMFIHPTLQLDLGLLETHLHNVKAQKEKLLVDAGVTCKKDLMSNDKFAELLRGEGVIPPTKVSPTTGKTTYAFAKSDEAFRDLLEHENTNVQALVNARLGNKSTLEETRTQRFIDIANRGRLPVPIKYFAAHTGRWGGFDKINLQNLPSRGPNAKVLKKAIVAPHGYQLVEADSSQIEARVLAWLAEQNDLVDDFANKRDVYKKMAMSIYNIDNEEDVDKGQRFIGKTTILGAGYGMGAARFQDQTKTLGVELELNEARRIIEIYRKKNDKIRQLWNDCNTMLGKLLQGDHYAFGKYGVVKCVPEEQALQLPTGQLIRYTGLKMEMREGRPEYSYLQRRQMRTRIYGGKVVENLCQALARCIIGYQMILIAKKYQVVMTVHDSIICCVKDHEVEEAQAYVEECMRKVPAWAEGLPIDCESGVAKNYGDCE